jgi:hypothetical protein
LSTQTQVRRDTLTNINTVTPANGEIAYNITNKRIHMGDGSTAGGIPHVNYLDLLQGVFDYASAGGTANALTATLLKTPTLASGLRLRVKATATNTAATTINVNGTGAKNIYKVTAGVLSALVAGDIINGVIYDLHYDGTQFQLGGGGGSSLMDYDLIASVSTASGGSTADFTLTSDFNAYMFVFASVRDTSTDIRLRMRRTSGAFDTTAGRYQSSTLKQISTTLTGLNDSSATSVFICGKGGASEYYSGQVIVVGTQITPNDVGVYSTMGSGLAGGGNQESWNSSGRYNAAGLTCDGVRFYTGGTFNAGTIYQYGLRKS